MSDEIEFKPRAIGVIFADQVVAGDVLFASYHAHPASSEDERPSAFSHGELLVCAWVRVGQVKHHTEATVTFLSTVVDDPDLHRWVEYPRDAPIVFAPSAAMQS